MQQVPKATVRVQRAVVVVSFAHSVLDAEPVAHRPGCGLIFSHSVLERFLTTVF